MSVDGSSHEEILEWVDESYDLPYGAERVRLLERASTAAETLGDLSVVHAANMALCLAGTFGGHPEIAMAAFARCAGLFESDPLTFPERSELDIQNWGVDLIWASKWVVGNLVDYPTISRERIDASLKDVHQRFERNGLSLRPVHSSEAGMAWDLGDGIDAVLESMRAFGQTPRDRYSDCRACETDFLVRVEVWRNDPAAALRVAEPILSGRQKCAEVPARTYVRLLEPLRALGELSRAAGFLDSAYEQMKDNIDHITSIADCVAHLTLVGELERAAEMYKRHSPWLRQLRTPLRRLECSWSARLLGQRLMSEGQPFAFEALEGQHALDALDKEIAEVSLAFDARNGNDFVSQRSKRFPDRVA